MTLREGRVFYPTQARAGFEFSIEDVITQEYLFVRETRARPYKDLKSELV